MVDEDDKSLADVKDSAARDPHRVSSGAQPTCAPATGRLLEKFLTGEKAPQGDEYGLEKVEKLALRGQRARPARCPTTRP